MGSSPFDRLYSGNRSYFLLLRVLRCFSSPRSLRANRTVTGSLPPGCPIRKSAASAGICPSPRLFAAYHVLLRLREPRHPPCALADSVLSLKHVRQVYMPRLFQTADGLPLLREAAPPGARCDFFLHFAFAFSLSALPPFPLTSPPRGDRVKVSDGFHPCHRSRLFVWRITDSNR